MQGSNPAREVPEQKQRVSITLLPYDEEPGAPLQKDGTLTDERIRCCWKGMRKRVDNVRSSEDACGISETKKLRPAQNLPFDLSLVPKSLLWVRKRAFKLVIRSGYTFPAQGIPSA